MKVWTAVIIVWTLDINSNFDIARHNFILLIRLVFPKKHARIITNAIHITFAGTEVFWLVSALNATENKHAIFSFMVFQKA